jgi:hypothetical protein
MTRLSYGLVALALGGFLLVTAASARAQEGTFVHDFRFCLGDFALCAAATCTPTGGTIEVRGPDGTTPSFPAAECTCPIFNGPAIADVNGGNMQGSCDPPPGRNRLWSLYLPASNIPQKITHWSRLAFLSQAPAFLCPAGHANTAVNCFSFACVRSGKTLNGVELATCTCPLGEAFDGTPMSADTPFFTQAGQCDVDICSQHPVSWTTIPLDDLQPGQCIAIPNLHLKTGSGLPF